MKVVSPVMTLRQFLIATTFVIQLANAADSPAVADAGNNVPDLAFGFAQRCVEDGIHLKPLEVIASRSQKLRVQEKTMLDIVAAVREETRGVDGETGDIIDPLSVKQDKWRQAVKPSSRRAQVQGRSVLVQGLHGSYFAVA